MRKRCVACWLTLVMLICLLPMAVFAEESPCFAGEPMEVSVRRGAVTVPLAGMDGTQNVIAAFYSEDGRLVGIAAGKPAADAESISLKATLSKTAASLRVFLTDAATKKPLCEPLDWTASDVEPAETVAELGVVRRLAESSAVGSVEPYSEYWTDWNSSVTEDLSAAPALAYSLTFGDKTSFAGLPAGYDPEALLEWGKDPGLNVDILHQYGYDGEGAVIAYVDQPIGQHEEYNTDKLHYTNNTTSTTTMHGPAVLSLLAGREIGVAPEAEVYFYGHAAWDEDQATHAECLYQIIEQNESLPEDEKITMVGFSDNIDNSEENADALREAVQACEDAGIMVWFCGENGAMSFLPMSDKNDPSNLVVESWGGGMPSLVYVPSAGRTTAANQGRAEYIYWASGGLSWTMPYTLGLYAIVGEIDPTLTQDEMRELIVSTAYDCGGRAVVNPVEFVAAALEGVGREDEAETLRDAVAARQKYLYAVMDTAAMEEEDLSAVGSYLASHTEATVLVVDAASFANAGELYETMQADAESREGEIVGVQIFGTPAMVPAFQVQYKVQMYTDVDDAGLFLTDLFYGNFENEPQRIAEGYNVMDHFAEGWDVDLVPQWPVARLPLEKGEYTDFFAKYMEFVDDTGLQRLSLVNFSNPIFASTKHIDDMGTFLKRMDTEFDLLDTPYRLYGNKLGQYPVKTSVLGGFTAENLAAENEDGIVEFLINSHGQWDNIDKCYFKNGQEIRESLIKMDTIGAVLDDNPYYLDCWTCLNGMGMQNNLTTAALEGQCVGMFSATAIISNNGVNCNASLSAMKQSNFYYFYYNYLKALHEGASRSEAFCAGQRAYAEALIADSVNGIRQGEGNYQFNLCNLLAYHNFGVLEPNHASVAFTADGYIAQAGQSVPKDEIDQGGGGGDGGNWDSISVTDGQPVGDVIEIDAYVSDKLKSDTFTAHNYTAQMLDNGYLRLTLEYSITSSMEVSIFDPPNGERFMRVGSVPAGEHNTLVCDLLQEDVRAANEGITLMISKSDDDRVSLFVKTSNLF